MGCTSLESDVSMLPNMLEAMQPHARSAIVPSQTETSYKAIFDCQNGTKQPDSEHSENSQVSRSMPILQDYFHNQCCVNEAWRTSYA